MKKIILLAIISVFLLTVCSVKAQQESQFALYTRNQFIYNPSAITGSNNFVASLQLRDQWVGIDGAPRMSLVSIHGLVTKNTGVGGMVTKDMKGIFENYVANLAYSYRLSLGVDQSLDMGVSGGIAQRHINRSKIDVKNLSDYALQDDYFDKISFIAAAGLTYRYKTLTLSASSPTLYNGEDEIYIQSVNMFASYGVNIYNQKIKIEPSVLYRYVKNNPAQVDINLFAEYREIIWLLATYRSTKDYIFGAGIKFTNFSLGYAHEINGSSISNISKGSNEILLQYQIKSKKRKLY